MKVYLKAERDWMGGKEMWYIVNEKGRFVEKFYPCKTRRAVLRVFNERNNGEYELQEHEIKIDHYAKARNMKPKAGWALG